jgi:hypothetical protein
LLAAQTMVDSADPINFTNSISQSGRGILFQMVAGDVSALPDQTVPNNVFGVPTTSLAGGAFGTVYASSAPMNAFDLSPSTYNPDDTVPGLLSGSDPIVRGTSFLSISSAVQGLVESGFTNSGVLLNPAVINSLDSDDDRLANDSSIENILTNVAAVPAPIANAVATGLDDGFLGLNLSQVDGNGALGAGLNSLVRFKAGAHSSLLSPESSLSVTTAMQCQMSVFLNSNGSAVPSLADCNVTDDIIHDAIPNPLVP